MSIPRLIPGCLLGGLLLFAPHVLAQVDVSLEPSAVTGTDEGVVRETVTIALPATPGETAVGDVSPSTLSADERRQRFRRLSRSPLATERMPQPDGSVLFSVRNLLYAPLTVEIEPATSQGAQVELRSSGRATLPPLGWLQVARIVGLNPLEIVQVTFVYSAVVGDPAAVHDDRVVYAWPFPRSVRAPLSQGPNGPTHHDDFSRFAIDLAVPEGTPVLAARGGTVVALENRYFEAGMDRQRFADRANQVRILHDDGSMGLYAHLFPASIHLEPGQRVQVGDQIGLSGNTGYSSGPHLHFVVLVHRDMQSVSVPFRMSGVNAR